jgi:hypothetical protein
MSIVLTPLSEKAKKDQQILLFPLNQKDYLS